MKVLILITKAEIGGAQVFVLKLAESLKKLGCEVDVAGGEGDFLLNELSKRDIKFHYINSLKRNVNVFNTVYFLFDLYKFLKKNRYDLVHLNSTNTLVGVIASYFIKKRPKFVFTFHGMSFLDKNYEINGVLRSGIKFYFSSLLRLIDDYVFVSKCNYNESAQIGLTDHGHVIYNGLRESDLDFSGREDARQFLCGIDAGITSDDFIIGSVGRLAPPKNYEFLINNFGRIKERIPEAKIAIIGDGPNFELYKSMIKEKGLEKDFILLGAIENSYKYIKAFDLFTLPSRYEGLSISIIEALYAGLPVLASDIGGNREVMNNDSRQLYRFDDIEDYVAKLAAIKENHDQISSFNLEIKELFSLDKMVESYKNLYDKLVNRH